MSIYFYIGLLVIILLVLFYLPAGLWMMTRISGIRVTFFELALMKLRRLRVREIVNGMIMLHMADIRIDIKVLEAHSLAGGSITNVVYGMVTAKKAGLKLTFDKAAKADLSGINLQDAVHQHLEKQNAKGVLFE